MAHKNHYDPTNISQDDYNWLLGRGQYRQERYTHSLFFGDIADANLAKSLLPEILDDDARIDNPLITASSIECRFTTSRPVAGLNQQFLLTTIRPLSYQLNQ